MDTAWTHGLCRDNSPTCVSNEVTVIEVVHFHLTSSMAFLRLEN